MRQFVPIFLTLPNRDEICRVLASTLFHSVAGFYIPC